MTTLRNDYKDIVRNHTSSHKVAIVACGCGSLISKFLCVPGASKLIDSLTLLSSFDSIDEFLSPHNIDIPNYAVSDERATDLYNQLASNYNNGKNYCIAITGALVTNRYRKGEDRAYICHGPAGKIPKIEHLLLEKIEEQQYNTCTPDDLFWHRFDQENQIFQIVKRIISEDMKIAYSNAIPTNT